MTRSACTIVVAALLASACSGATPRRGVTADEPPGPAAAAEPGSRPGAADPERSAAGRGTTGGVTTGGAGPASTGRTLD